MKLPPSSEQTEGVESTSRLSKMLQWPGSALCSLWDRTTRPAHIVGAEEARSTPKRRGKRPKKCIALSVFRPRIESSTSRSVYSDLSSRSCGIFILWKIADSVGDEIVVGDVVCLIF